jgi:hypothetical protein
MTELLRKTHCRIIWADRTPAVGKAFVWSVPQPDTE